MPKLKLSKKLLTALYVSLWIIGLLFIVGGFFFTVSPEDRPGYYVGVAVGAVIMLIMKSYEEYRKAQREEELRRIKEAIRETLWELRQK